MGYDSVEASIIRLTRRNYEKAVRVPTEYTARVTKAESDSFDTWVKARPADDFKMVQPFLQTNFDLCKEYSDFFPGYAHPMDPLIDNYEYGMKAARIREIFDELRKELVPVVEAITSQEPEDSSFMHRIFPGDRQIAFGESIIKEFGYDFNRGRQDMAPHPFTQGTSIGDVRITTRVYEDNFSSAMFSTFHEGGHAMYEQGCDPAFERTPVCGGTSLGVHESQSRLWENVVGRSRAFWDHNYPILKQQFPEQLADIPLDKFYRGINHVERSLIRVEADEVTYNLHVMMRFGFEYDVMDGKMAVEELPEAWKDRMESDIGVRPEDDRDGVMQDIHWYSGIIGYFQCYTLGNIMCSQFYDAALKAHPEITEEIGQGKYDTLYNWLKENIYRHGKRYTANELLRNATGQELTIKPYMNYIKTKYGELYDL
jgi:carboxypeptidase Taq